LAHPLPEEFPGVVRGVETMDCCIIGPFDPIIGG